MLVSPKTWFVAALVALSACGTTPGGAALCATGTHCVADTDCASGSRCNTALSPPACQPLYCGTSGSACSQGYFCESQNCVKQACLSTTAGTPLGNVVPTTITYSIAADGGYGTSLIFTDDARNDCAAWTALVDYGNAAWLRVGSSAGQLTEGQVVGWITDADALAGRGRSPYAVFTRDTLSGLSLHKRQGSVTVVHLPTAQKPEFTVTLTAADGGLDGTFTVRPVCP